MGTKTGIENRAFELEIVSDSKTTEPEESSNTPNNNIIDKIYNGSKVETEDSNDAGDDDRCGFGIFSPDWIQRFATKRSFMVVFTLLGVIQGMSWSYFTATISTLEKRFEITSQMAGIVMTGNEISQITFSLIISYYGGKGHRPRWIATGVLFSALACFVLASPHFFFGSGTKALSFTEEYFYLGEQDGGNLNVPHSESNASFFGDLSKKGKVELCVGGNKGDFCTNSEVHFAALVLIFLSQFVSGIGVLLFFTLGGPYLDDNTKRTNIPIVFGVTMSLRLIGPTIGFLIASGTLKLYVNPLLTPTITPENPNWIGAWWLGWVIFGTCMSISAFFIALFPKRLKRKNGNRVIKEEPGAPETVPKLSDIPRAVKLLLKNKLNVVNNLAGVFHLFAAIGYWTYMPKYMETIFMQTASTASVMSGIVGIFSQATGMMLSGFLISRYQFSARKLAAWNVLTSLMYVAVKVSFTQIGCNVGTISFGTEKTDGTWNLTAACNENCHCKTSKIFPVCHEEMNTVYYSACHAGCTVYENNTISNCSCIPDPDASVKLGNCAEGCSQIFMLFLAITAIVKFVDATGRIGNLLISYRCVSLEERSLSIGLHILLLSALALLPAPILFGKIIDSVCLVWSGASCGKSGNCMFYDGQQLRYIFNLTAAAFTFVGAFCDCLVWYFSKGLELYKEPDTFHDDCAGNKSPEQVKEGIVGG